MATIAASAPSKAFPRLQIASRLESWLEGERDQLILWLPVMLAAGAACWFALPDPRSWIIAMLVLAGIGAGAMAVGGAGRARRVVAIGCAAAALGLALVWWRAERVAAPVLDRIVIARLEGRIERIESLPARQLVRITLLLRAWDREDAVRPERLRLNIDRHDVPAGLGEGASIRLRARLMPPAAPAVPGAYDFARVAWFDRLGATGRGFAPIEVRIPGVPASPLRVRLTEHIETRLDGSSGGIAAALATGDMGAIADEDAAAMRRAGLAHLLSVSGLHITATVAIVMMLASRTLALSRRIALTGRVPLIAAAAGALAAIFYTWLTGAQVPTIRSCVASLMVLAALAAGREAVTLRLVATGALVVLLIWPEAVVSPSFQLSFAAVTAIVALHEHPAIRAAFLPREEARWRRITRSTASLLLTGAVVELALMPIAIFHFHQAGIYGALANIVAIPLTTFIIMPLEAMALAFDAIGAGGPFWWLDDRAIRLLLGLAHRVAAAPGAVVAVPGAPASAFATTVAGALWLGLWRSRLRWIGAVPLLAGAIGMAWPGAPDLIVTGDGRHVGWRTNRGVAILRDRAGDYVRGQLAEGAGVDGEPTLLSDWPAARCTRDLCWLERRAAGRIWRVLATRSAYHVPTDALITRCIAADVIVSDRRVPRRCRARWLTLDRDTLRSTGGVAIDFAAGRVTAVRQPGDLHPWIAAPDHRSDRWRWR